MVDKHLRHYPLAEIALTSNPRSEFNASFRPPGRNYSPVMTCPVGASELLRNMADVSKGAGEFVAELIPGKPTFLRRRRVRLDMNTCTVN